MITFSEIPDALRYPGAYIEINGSMAGLGSDLPSVLLVGQKLPTGTAPAGEIVRISSVHDAVNKAGEGSMLAQMAKAYRRADETFDVFMLPYADNMAGVEAMGSIIVLAPATEDGTLSLYIGNKSITVGIGANWSVESIAAAIATAITEAGQDIPVVVMGDGSNGTVVLSARHKGTCGNGIDVRLNRNPDDRTPAGLQIDIAALANGTGDPDPGDLAAILGSNRWFRYVVLGITGSATMKAWHDESRRRYAPPIQAGFRVFSAVRGDYGSAAAYGETKNYEHLCCLALALDPSLPWEAAGVVAGAAAPKLWNNPVISLEGTELPGLTGISYFDWSQANSLLFKGMSIMEVGSDGTCYIKRLISMYQKRSDGSSDDAWLDINAAEVNERIRYEQRIGAIQAFRGTVAAKTDEGYRPGLPITTEDSVRAYLLSRYKNYLMRERGWVQGYDYYKSTLIVEQNADNPSRFDFRDDPVINSPFYILAGMNRFRKAVPTN